MVWPMPDIAPRYTWGGWDPGAVLACKPGRLSGQDSVAQDDDVNVVHTADHEVGTRLDEQLGVVRT